jgi:hypothetical protein
MAKLISTWDELAKIPESETHRIEIGDCNGWVIAKEPKSDKFSDRMTGYLSTHTFYGEQHHHSTRLLQSCGFDVEIDNWDAD